MKPTLKTFLIDDDTDDQEIFSFVMQEVYNPAQCFFANDGVQAIEKIKGDTLFIPDLIFIDINMPKINGVQCLAEIKKVSRLKNVPAYMYSTSAETEIVEECKRLGATDFIKKHTDITELKEELIRIISALKIPM